MVQLLAATQAELDRLSWERYRAALSPELLRAIEQAGTLTWLPVSISADASSALVDTVGPARAHEIYASAMTRMFATERWRPLVETGVRLLGFSPAAFVRWTKRGWSGMYRNCGEVSGHVLEDRRARITYDGLPPEVLRSAAWTESLASSWYGIFAFCAVRGAAAVDKRRQAEGCLTVELRWTERE